MPTPEEFGFNGESLVEYVVGAYQDYESKHGTFVNAIDRYWKQYKGERSRPKYLNENPIEGVNNSFVFETPRAVDSLATTRYRIIMAHDPPWEVLSQRNDIPEDVLYKISATHQFQFEKVQYPRNLRKGLTSLDLIGTLCVEEPWVSFPGNSPEPIWEGTGFVPRPLNQIFFSPNAMNIDDADYIGTVDIVTDYRLHQFKQSDILQTSWLHDGIDQALVDKTELMPDAVKRRLTNAGYKDFTHNKEMIIYHGPLPDQDSYEEWVVGVINRKHLVRLHKAVLPMRPFRLAYTNEIEQEAWALGVGPKAEHLQRMLNYNRDRIFNLITFAIFSMFKMSRLAGINQRDLRIKPFNIIPMDDINGLEALRPQIEAAQFGIKMEELLKEEFQSVTGASKNLQAISTDVTATEASLVMDQTLRRISVDTEIIANSLLRDHLYFAHKMNMLFLDRPIWTNIIGNDGNRIPVRVDPSDVAREVDFKIKISTDKDFRPQMMRRIIEFVQVFTSIRQQLPPDLQPNLKPFVEEFARLSGIDPRKVFPILAQVPNPMGQVQPPMSGVQEAVMRGIENNPSLLPQDKEVILNGRSGGMNGSTA